MLAVKGAFDCSCVSIQMTTHEFINHANCMYPVGCLCVGTFLHSFQEVLPTNTPQSPPLCLSSLQSPALVDHTHPQAVERSCSVSTYYRAQHFSYTVEPLYIAIEDTTATQLAVLYTVEPLYSAHHWDPAGCPVYSGTSL